jgi:hypothetical protein
MLGDVGVIGEVGIDDNVDGVCNRSPMGSGAVAFHRKKEANGPGDFALGKGLSLRYPLE